MPITLRVPQRHSDTPLQQYMPDYPIDSLVSWGCGTACTMFAIVDAKTGSVYVAPFTVSMGEHLNQEEDLIEYRPDSKLLIITGDLNEENYGKYYYVWEKGRLRLLRKTQPKEVTSEE